MKATREVHDQVDILMRHVASLEIRIEDLERQQERSFARIVEYLFEIADSVDRLLATDAPSVDGLMGLRRQVSEFLGAEQVHAFRPVIGERADPSTIEVVATTQGGSEAPGTVVQVFHDGYQRGDRILRRAGIEIRRA